MTRSASPTIRFWITLLQLTGLLTIEDNTGTAWFSVGFWLGFLINALAAEVYLTYRPTADGTARPTPAETMS